MDYRYEIDELMKGYKISVSISCPSALLQEVQTYCINNHLNQSEGFVKLTRLGITYSLLLKAQADMKKEALDAAAKVIVESKPKTPRKKPTT